VSRPPRCCERLQIVGRRSGLAALIGALAVAGAAAATGFQQLPAAVYRTVAVSAGGRIYVLGGLDSAGVTVDSVEAFDPRDGSVQAAGTLALPTHGSAAVQLGGRILIFGGASTSVHDTVQQYFAATGRSRVIATMPTVRADVTAAVAAGRAILVGGFDGSGPQATVWQTTDGMHFTVAAHLPQPVRYPAVAAVGDAVYVFGGLISGGEYTGDFTDAVQRVDPARGTATVVARLPTPLAHAMAAVVGGRLYVLGGSTPAGPSSAIERFDPTRDRLTPAGRLPQPRTDAAVAVAGSTIYLLGGISSSGPVAAITAVQPR
jgi:N-acetylneuraminic acid mutarotase